ncbi:MAG: hypothetical protein A2X49_17215 [Lentisphaerae bacterium GWF2_52_8]|nr:MAG: hypothetical protein A2X49_17215 [Lentisphaerae bacterium GWF2_52_8]
MSSDPKKPLASRRHEMFCRHYASLAWGDARGAYLAAGYKDGSSVAKQAAALLLRDDVAARIHHLRTLMLELLGIDRVWLAEQRRKIVENASRESDRLRALKDLERGLGLLPPAHEEIVEAGDFIVRFGGDPDHSAI